MKPSSSLCQPRKTHLSVMILLALSAMQAEGADRYTWTGSLSNNANTPGNWTFTPNASPGHDTQYVINGGQNVPTLILDESTNTNQPLMMYGALEVGQAAGTQGIFRIHRTSDGAYHLYTLNTQVGINGGTGTLDLRADASSNSYMQTVLAVSQQLNIGAGTGSQGSVNILGSGKSTSEQAGYYATIDAGQADLAIGTAGGRGTLNINGGSLNSTQHAYGRTTPSLMLGSGLNSVGTINVLGGGKLAHGLGGPMNTLDGIARIGHAGGTGTLTVSGQVDDDTISRAHFGSGLIVGDGTGSSGRINVTQGGELLTGSACDPCYGTISTLPVQLGVNGGSGYALIDGSGSAGNPSTWRVLGPYSYSGAPVSPGSMEFGNPGELYIGASGRGEVTVSNGGVLSLGEGAYSYVYDNSDPSQPKSYYTLVNYFGGSGTLYIAKDAGSTGIINIGAAQGQAAQAIGAIDAAAIRFGAGTGTLVFNHTSTDGYIPLLPQLISGAGSSNILHLAGVTRLTDVETSGMDQGTFRGTTRISGGTMVIDTRLGGSVIVDGRGTLAGNGRAGATTIKSGGTLSPGRYAIDQDNTSRLYVDSLVMEAGSLFDISADEFAQSDMLWATTANGGTGTIDIQGASLMVRGRPGAWKLIGFPYTIMAADTSITGTFASYTTDMAFLKVKPEYYNDVVILRTSRNETKIPDITDTDNGKGPGGAIEDLEPGNPIIDEVIGMTPDQARRALINLGGEIHGSAHSAALLSSRYARAAVNQHLQDSTNLLPADTHKALWLDTWAHDGHISSDGNAARLDHKGTGFLLGADIYRSETATLGMALGYERSRIEIGELRDSKADIDAAHLLAYGRTRLGSIDLRGALGYSYLDLDTTRHVNVPELAGKYTADYSGRLLQAYAEASHDIQTTATTRLTPYANLAYQQLRTRSFNEKGGAAALSGNTNTNQLTSSVLGIRALYTPNENHMFYADAGWRHNFGSQAPEVDLRFSSGGGTFAIRGVSLNRDSVIAGLGADLKVRDNTRIRIGYEGEFGGHIRDHAAKARIEWRF